MRGARSLNTVHTSSSHRVAREPVKTQEGLRGVRREPSQPASKPITQNVYDRRGQTRVGSGGVDNGGGGGGNGHWTTDTGMAPGLPGGGGGSNSGGKSTNARNGGIPVGGNTGPVDNPSVVKSGRENAMGTTSIDSAFGAMAPCWRLLERAKAYMEQVSFPRKMCMIFLGYV